MDEPELSDLYALHNREEQTRAGCLHTTSPISTFGIKITINYQIVTSFVEVVRKRLRRDLICLGEA